MNALSPAKVQPRLDRRRREQRSWRSWSRTSSCRLAIGKKGQNVRLAAKLVGWRIDIKSEEEKRREVEAQLERLEMPDEEGGMGEGELVLVLPDIHDEIVESLRQAGYQTAGMVAAASIEDLMTIPGIDEGTAESVLQSAEAQAQVEADAQAQADADAQAQADADAQAQADADAQAQADADAQPQVEVDAQEQADADAQGDPDAQAQVADADAQAEADTAEPREAPEADVTGEAGPKGEAAADDAEPQGK